MSMVGGRGRGTFRCKKKSRPESQGAKAGEALKYLSVRNIIRKAWVSKDGSSLSCGLKHALISCIVMKEAFK